ncbi:MAG: glycosyltransferase [Promethearchaeota archaeon]
MIKTIAFICPPLQGHINPMISLAHRLSKKNLDLKFIGLLDSANYIRKFSFIPIGKDIFPEGSIKKITSKMSRLKGLRMGRVWQKRFTNKWSDVVCRELPKVIEREGIDYIICDQLEAAVALVADHINIPFISICNAMAIVMDVKLPPFFTSWKYNISKMRIHNLKGVYKVTDFILKRDTRVLESWRKKWDMEKRTGMKRYFAVSNLATISQQTKSLEFPLTKVNKDWFYLGPLRNGAVLPYTSPDLPKDNVKNVYISLGTLLGSRYRLIHKCVQASKAVGLRPIVVHAGLLDENQVKELERDALVFDYLRQPEIFEECEILISHCGLNTALDALSYGRPIIAIPIGIEQGAIATKLKRAGCAIVIKKQKKGKIQKALTQIISDQNYKENAQKIKEEIIASGGIEKAVEIINKQIT